MKQLRFVALALLACDSPTDLEEIAPSIRIDNRNYQLQPSSAGLHGEIPFAFTNPLADTIYLASGAGALYRWDGRR